MQSGLSGAYFPSVWAAKDSQGRGRPRRPGAGTNPPSTPPPLSAARRLSEANLHKRGQLKLPRPCGAGWGELARSVDPETTPAPGFRNLSLGPAAEAGGKTGPGGPRGKVGGGTGKARSARESSREGKRGGATLEAGTAGPPRSER